MATTLRRLNKLPEAITFFKTLIGQQAHVGDASFGLAQAYLASGMNREGWQWFNVYRPQILKNLPTRAQLANKRVIILAEWGLGDMMHYIRYAQLLKQAGAYVIVQAAPALVHLLALCSYIDEVIPHGDALPQADYQIPLMCLPTLFNTDDAPVPPATGYLQADQELQRAWRTMLLPDTNLKVGVCWDIGHHDTNFVGWQRSVPLHYWTPLQHINGMSLYSLQKDGIKQALAYPALHIKTFGKNFDVTYGGFMDSAALIKNLDLVITVDTSIAHLSGALGVPTWVLLPYSPDYRWTLNGNTTPWYPTMRLFRQKEAGNWNTVMQEVAQELQAFIRAEKN
jgi:hypothetical protein